MSARQNAVYFIGAAKDGETHYWAATTSDAQSAILAVQDRLGPDWEVGVSGHFRVKQAYLEALDLTPRSVRRIKYTD